jgi:hypothetical protein
MKSKTLLTLGLCAVAASVFSGCATQKTRTGRNNTILGGLATINTGSYKPVVPATIDGDFTKFVGFTNPSGTETTFLWGAFTLTDY